MRLKNYAAALAAVLLGCGALFHAKDAQAQFYVQCNTTTMVDCNTTSNPGNGQQGMPAWLSFGGQNQNTQFLSPAWTLPANSLLGNPTGATGGFGPITAGTNITISGGVISAAATAAVSFGALTTATNTQAAMLCGSGCSIGVTGSGTIIATQIPVTGVTGLGTGVATFLENPSSFNMLSMLTTKTGTGNAVFGTAPTLTGLTLGDVTGSTQCLHVNSAGVVSGAGPDCGTGAVSLTASGSNVVLSPSTITNTGTIGFTTTPTFTTVNGIGPSTWLVSGGALGTPSSGIATNLTGTATNLNIGGNAATATTAISASSAATAGLASNIGGGVAGSIPYQVGSGSTTMLAPSAGVLVGGTTPIYSTSPTLNGANFTGIPNAAISGLGTFATQNYATPPPIGAGTPAAVTGTTLTATTQFSGPGTGLTGTASALNIGGNAATANSATTATTAANIAGGAANELDYQTAAGATGFLTAGTNITISGGSISAAGSSAFNTLTSGTNTTMAALCGTGCSIGVTGSGTNAATSAPVAGITGLGSGIPTFLANPTAANLGSAVTGASLVAGTNISITGTWPNQTVTASGSAGSAFNSITSGSNTTATMTLGTGGTLTYSGSGVVNANETGGTPFGTFATQNYATPPPIGAGTPAAVTGTTLTATSQFSGPGTGLTGTAASLNIGGTAATATTATAANNLSGGAAGSIPYQTAANTTSLLAAGSGVLVGGTTPAYSTTPTLTGTNFSGVPTTGLTGTLQAAQSPAYTGDATNTAGSLAMTVKRINGTALSGLATGILKNTTTTGVPSIAAASDIVATFSGCSGTQYLGADGACHTASGTLSASGTPAQYQTPCWASASTISAFGPGTSGQVLTSNGAGSCPSYQSGTSYTGLPANSAVAASDLIAGYPTAGPLGSYTVGQFLQVPSSSVASATSITPSCALNGQTGFGSNTVTAGTLTVNAPTGCTPGEGQILVTHIKYTNTQTYSWNAAYENGAITLPTATSGSTVGDWVGFRYDSINSKWAAMAANAGSGGGSGSVTSVAATVPSFLSVAGSPITTAGTLALSYSGTALPVANGGTGATAATGTGNVVLAAAPTISNPTFTGGGAFGTPASMTATNVTGLPLAGVVALTSNNLFGNAGSGNANVSVGAGLTMSSSGLSATTVINAQTGTSYTFLATDSAKLVTHSNASATADTLPVATTSGFGAGFAMDVQNLGVGTVTITPTTSTINGAATLVLKQNEGCSINSDGTNYQVSACTAVTPAVNLAGTGHGGVTGILPQGNLPATSTQTIASGTAALGTGAISSGTCATVVTATATGTATTDVISADFNADPTAVTGYIPSASGMLTIIKYPTANTVNFKVCNNTSSSITPGAITLNWRVVR